MPEPCAKSTFTGAHGWAVERVEVIEDGRGSFATVVRCKFCQHTAPPDVADRMLAIDAETREYRRARGRLRTMDSEFKQLRKGRKG